MNDNTMIKNSFKKAMMHREKSDKSFGKSNRKLFLSEISRKNSHKVFKGALTKLDKDR